MEKKKKKLISFLIQNISFKIHFIEQKKTKLKNKITESTIFIFILNYIVKENSPHHIKNRWELFSVS